MNNHQTLYQSLHRKLMSVKDFQSLIQQAEKRLNARSIATREAIEMAQKPLIKLFIPNAQMTWLLSELDPEEPEIAFGLCDLGVGFPELGSVSIRDLVMLRGPLGLSVEKERSFEPMHTLVEYARIARSHRQIVA